MTETEERLQAALDADPGNSLLRLVLADHLEECGDERAAGYRVLGELGREPFLQPHNTLRWHYWGHYDSDPWHLPPPWWGKFDRRTPDVRAYTRRECDDAAALAWLDLTDAERRAVLGAAAQLTGG